MICIYEQKRMKHKEVWEKEKIRRVPDRNLMHSVKEKSVSNYEPLEYLH